MTSAAVRHAQPEDRDTLLTVLTEAFAADPFWTHFLPDPDRPGFARETALRDCLAADVDTYLPHGHTYLVGDRAAALWTAPGIHSVDDELAERFAAHVDDEVLEASFPQLMEMYAWRPDEPHFYLHIIGARHHARGQGLGSALLGRILDICDAEGTPAYLEATTPQSASLYARHGFEQIGTIDFSPTVALRPMLRSAA